MGPQKKDDNYVKPVDEDIDLVQLLNRTGGTLNRAFLWFEKVLLAFVNGILQILIFLRRNLIWLLLGACIGTAYGAYLHYKNGAKYSSSMTVKANFKSAKALYEAMNYFNTLAGSGRTKELASVLDVSPTEAASLLFFETKPLKSELTTTALYKELFFDIDNRDQTRVDSFISKTIDYKAFKENLTKYDYPEHEVSVVSTNPQIFLKIQQGIIDHVSSNQFLQAINAVSQESNTTETNLLLASISGLDSLRQAYNKRLAFGGETNDFRWGNISFEHNKMQITAPELELYDKMLQLKDELRAIKNKSAHQNKILQVYVPFNPIGTKQGFLQQNVVEYAYTGLLLTLLAVLLVTLSRYLARKDHRRKFSAEDQP